MWSTNDGPRLEYVVDEIVRAEDRVEVLDRGRTVIDCAASP
jgi:hypothetical protein